MADIPPAESVDDALRRATDAVDALKCAKPGNAAEGRKRAAELVRQQQELLDASRRIADGAVAKRLTGTNGHAKGKQADVFTDEVLQALARGLVPFLHELIAETLEKKRVLTDGGIWNSEKAYRPGAVVTHDGAPWVCLQPNKSTKPGKSDAWRLQGKSHR